jgi:hypothetical protein
VLSVKCPVLSKSTFDKRDVILKELPATEESPKFQRFPVSAVNSPCASF